MSGGHWSFWLYVTNLWHTCRDGRGPVWEQMRAECSGVLLGTEVRLPEPPAEYSGRGGGGPPLMPVSPAALQMSTSAGPSRRPAEGT